MVSAEKRIARYNARMVAANIDPVRLAVITAQKANFAAYATEYTEIQTRLRDALGSYGIPVIQYAAYEAFAGQLYHLTKKFTGLTLTAAWTQLVDKWSDDAHLGTGSSVFLNMIVVDVFHLTVAPITP